MSSPARYLFGFDIGGTFTDFVLSNTTTGEIETYKTLTTPSEPARAVIEGWDVLLDRVGAAGSDVTLSIHGTTELFAIFLAGAAGFRIGTAIAFPGESTRMDAAVAAAGASSVSRTSATASSTSSSTGAAPLSTTWTASCCSASSRP